MISLGSKRRDQLVAELEETAAAVRELAACRIINPAYREKLNAAADLYEARAENFSRAQAS